MNQNRLKRVREYMEAQGFQQILISSTASVYYLTGIWVEPMERMLALYLDLEGRCILYGNALFGLLPQEGLELAVHSDSDDPCGRLIRDLRPGKLGVDKSWPSRFLIRLLEGRPDVQPAVGSAPVDLARMRKDADETAWMRETSHINDQVMASAIAALREGVREDEIAALVESLFREHGADRSGEGQLVCFGANGADPHHAPGASRLRRGDSVVLDIFTPIRRYWCDMTRTVFFGEASARQREVYKAVKAANLAAEAAIRPGVPLREVDGAARKVIADAGYGAQFTHRLGHGCGIDCHEPPDNSASSGAVCEAGMVFSVEPGIYLPGEFGVRIEDLVLVTETGCQVLNQSPKDLRIV